MSVKIVPSSNYYSFYFFLVPEEKFLRTIELEEQFGGKTYQAQKSKDEKVKAASKGKAAIGFVYQDSTEKTEEIPPGKLQAVVYFDQQTLACTCVCMFENEEKHLKIMNKVPFPLCAQEAHVRHTKKNEEKSLLVSDLE